MPTERRVLWNLVFGAPPFLALPVVLGAIRAGSSPNRLWPVAGFLMVWAGSAGCISLVNKASRRRAFRLRNVPVPRGVRLRKPIWLSLDIPSVTVGVAGALGAIAAIIGFPGVGLGIALALIGLGAFAGFSVPFGSADLTFEDGGLRLHKGSAQCLLPWTSIKEIESIGPESFFFTKLSIADPDRVVESVVPETPQDRKRVETLVTRTGAMQGEIVLERWAAGLDGASLVRAIREGMAGRPPQMN